MARRGRGGRKVEGPLAEGGVMGAFGVARRQNTPTNFRYILSGPGVSGGYVRLAPLSL